MCWPSVVGPACILPVHFMFCGCNVDFARLRVPRLMSRVLVAISVSVSAKAV